LPDGWSGSSTTNTITATPGENASAGNITVTANNGCGSSSSTSALSVTTHLPLPKFMDYNLGADPAYNTPKLQMQYLADRPTNNNLDATVYGGFFQWGRKPMDYAVNSSVTPPLRYGGGTGDNYAPNLTTRAASLRDQNANPVYDAATGQITWIGDPAQNADLFHIYQNASPYDWRGTGNQDNTLWGNGAAIGTATPGGGVLHTDGNHYQQPVRTVNDPCPTGWRVPTQDDWELMGSYDCNPMGPGGNFSVSSGIGRPTNGLVWIGVRCSGGTCNIDSDWSTSTRGGYAIYYASDWDAAALTDADNLCAATAPEPLLFLPAAGFRDSSSGSIYNVGTYGYYWSSSIISSSIHVHHLTFYNTYVSPSQGTQRAGGLSVRCVAE